MRNILAVDSSSSLRSHYLHWLWPEIGSLLEGCYRKGDSSCPEYYK